MSRAFLPGVRRGLVRGHVRFLVRHYIGRPLSVRRRLRDVRRRLRQRKGRQFFLDGPGLPQMLQFPHGFREGTLQPAALHRKPIQQSHLLVSSHSLHIDRALADFQPHQLPLRRDHLFDQQLLGRAARPPFGLQGSDSPQFVFDLPLCFGARGQFGRTKPSWPLAYALLFSCCSRENSGMCHPVPWGWLRCFCFRRMRDQNKFARRVTELSGHFSIGFDSQFWRRRRGGEGGLPTQGRSSPAWIASPQRISPRSFGHRASAVPCAEGLPC